jgi:hypothetical protein
MSEFNNIIDTRTWTAGEISTGIIVDLNKEIFIDTSTWISTDLSTLNIIEFIFLDSDTELGPYIFPITSLEDQVPSKNTYDGWWTIVETYDDHIYYPLRLFKDYNKCSDSINSNVDTIIDSMHRPECNRIGCDCLVICKDCDHCIRCKYIRGECQCNEICQVCNQSKVAMKNCYCCLKCAPQNCMKREFNSLQCYCRLVFTIGTD